MVFEGIRAIFNRGLSQHFQTTHSLNIHDVQTGKYSFAATLVGDREVRANEVNLYLNKLILIVNTIINGGNGFSIKSKFPSFS